MKESDEDVTVQPECNLRFEIFGELTRKCGLQAIQMVGYAWSKDFFDVLSPAKKKSFEIFYSTWI